MAVPNNQVDHYNDFGNTFESDILNAPNPEIWTTDKDPNSVMNKQMILRLSDQEKCVKRYFGEAYPVLDMGCGFGRQSLMMSRLGFRVTGIDSSQSLIRIGQKLATKGSYNVDFICASVADYNLADRFSQVTLFDVIEHFKPKERKPFLETLANRVSSENATIVITFPYMSVFSFLDVTKNLFKFVTSPISSISGKKEHPYPIPFYQCFDSVCTPFFKIKEKYRSGDTAYFILEKL